MKPTLPDLIYCVISAVLVSVLAGCTTSTPPGTRASNGTAGQANTATNQSLFLTGRLWHKTVHQAAADPGLRLSQAPPNPDVLVEYDEQSGKSNRLQHRSYWLFANATNVSKQLKPNFITQANCTNLQPILLLEATATNSPSPVGYCAVLATNQHSFNLWQDGSQVGSFDLPIYRAGPEATAGRIALTPLCVIADAAAVVVVAGVLVIVAGAGGPMGY